ncbi:sulfatase family protein [Paenibacillus chungangensis]|uniref:Sulfatase n=1 Tax=Paenibacillus chungangensis TaxID=696535 RepID=A0ABW3HL02_9BACL
MNIVYLHTHDTGRYIEPYGYAVPTPNLMQLATEGVLFRQAYCAGPTCSPSRAGLLTGMAPHSAGMLGLAHRGARLHDYNQHLVPYLKRNGYETVLCGIQHEAPEAAMIGYDHILGNPDYDMSNFSFRSVEWDEENANAAASYIRQQHDKPFFLSVGLFNTHLNFPDPDPGIQRDYVAMPYQFHDCAENREQWAAYMTSAQAADRCAGIVLEALKDSGLWEDTLIIFTTDHGLPFPRMKCSLFDSGIGVSLIIRAPHIERNGKAVDGLVSHLDVFPTICDIAGLRPPSWLQGYSLVPYLEGRSTSVRSSVYAEINHHVDYEPMRAVRTERYKYIRNFGECTYLPRNLDASMHGSFLLENGFLETEKPAEMLFDLYLDPVERTNLAQCSTYSEVRASMEKELLDWMEATNDPLLHGDVGII